MLKNNIISRMHQLIKQVVPKAIQLRHKIHRCPELAGEEFQTAKLIQAFLNKCNLSVFPPFLETDVSSLLQGPCKGKNIVLRADMDALPINEYHDVPYKSTHPGKMHACGHDGHIAILAGAAWVLSCLQKELNGSVRFIFQPGEEVQAMGKDLVEAGALEFGGLSPDLIFGIHGMPGYPEGTIISCLGTMMAAADFFKIKITGKGGHGSKPEYTIDPILTACRVVEALQSIVSRNINPQEAAVISVCRFESGNNQNIIPDHAFLEGTVRYLVPGYEKKISSLMERTISGICSSMGAEYEFFYENKYIPSVNSSEGAEIAEQVTKKYLGEEKWIYMNNASMGGDDFSFYLDKYPGAMCFIGLGEECPGLHNNKFDFNDNVITSGITFLVGIVLEELSHRVE